ncbi:multidrug DMT transporter permease [Saccharospirillum salsuginis]|nr:multidrug DMT transporter permease [Saccharospirillum salsuginis]
MHAGWNFLGKRRRTSVGLYALAFLWVGIVGLPWVIQAWDMVASFNTVIIGLVIATGFSQALYMIGLTLAYQNGELSVVYPLLRSMPLVILPVVGFVLDLPGDVGIGAMVGIGLIVCGCVFLPMNHFRDIKLAHYVNWATLFALIAAAGTAGYSLIDDQATRLIRALPGLSLSAGHIALIYVFLQAWSTAGWLYLAIWIKPAWRENAPATFSLHSQALQTGILLMGTYAMVVWAMAYARDVSYVVAFRQISILLGVALGLTVLKERLTAPKLAGSVLVFAGLVWVALG